MPLFEVARLAALLLKSRSDRGSERRRDDKTAAAPGSFPADVKDMGFVREQEFASVVVWRLRQVALAGHHLRCEFFRLDIVVPAAVTADRGPPKPEPWAADMLIKALKVLKSILLSIQLVGRKALSLRHPPPDQPSGPIFSCTFNTLMFISFTEPGIRIRIRMDPY